MTKQNCLLTLVFFITTLSFAQQKMINLNKEWNYLENPTKSLSDVKAANTWAKVDLPHTWNNKDVTDLIPGYRRDASWYQKALELVKKPGERYFLYFEGANSITELYINEKFVGTNIGAYIGFEIEITDFISTGQNDVMVRVDNSVYREVIPSQKSDFFIFGGIVRDLWLKTTPKIFIKNVHVVTPKVSAQKATTQVKVMIDGELNEVTHYAVVTRDPSQKVVFDKKRINLEEKNPRLTFQFSNPDLWDVDDPALYETEVTIFKGKTIVDTKKVQHGYRWFEFEEYGAFYLNGRRLLLRGTHRHEEHAGLGAAMPNDLHRKDMEMIKSVGANFVRLGHYPQDPEIYKACDELGLLVWDELPWCRGGVGNDTWKKNTTGYLESMINQNMNHPSIIIWSLGNEVYWLPDFENGGDRSKINSFLTSLNDLAHQLDPYRKTAIRKYYEGADIVDIFSPSIWSGWYSGNYKNYEKAIEKNHKKYPHFIHMEYGGSSHVGRHRESPINGDGFVNPNEWEEPINQVAVKNIAHHGDWSENYIVDLFDWYLMISETYDGFIGNAQWAFKDFGTPLRPENDIPYVNQKGLVDRAGNPKDAYYVFKSYWSDEPFAYIESHTWTERSGPEGVKRNVCVFSNAEKVKLVLNGKNVGEKVRDMSQFPACGLNWDVEFQEGKNDLVAIGYKDGKEIAKDQLQVNYRYKRAGNPQKLELSYEKIKGEEYLVTVTARDKEGLRCLGYEEKVYFQCLSGGNLVHNMGTPDGSSSISMSNGKATIRVKPDGSGNDVKMTVLNQDFKGSFLTIEQVQVMR